MLKRTHMCGDPRKGLIDETITICGWVHTWRNQGKGLIFVDVRDRAGITQVVFDQEDIPAEVMELADGIRREDVIAVRGVVRGREKANPKLPTGEIEVVGTQLEILAKTAPPPILPEEREEDLAGEEKRLQYRYLDLRRPRMQEILRIRHETARLARAFFSDHGFLEVETPMLIKTTPEGARDFIVPSRLYAGRWYALPQSPQIFKQILMISGCDRYFQIVRCFRDEDPRSDRQAEFSQIDLEMSFVDRDEVMEIMSGFIRQLWSEILGYEIGEIPVMSFAEAMDKYGVDRPDLRFGLEHCDVSDLAGQTEFKVFTEALAQPEGMVKAMVVPGGAGKMSRKVTDGYSKFVQEFGAGGVPTVKFTDNGFETGIAKFVSPIADALIERLGLKPGDLVFFAADKASVAHRALGELRNKIAADLGLREEGAWRFVWVVDFPMFERDEEGERWKSLHHPFTSPMPDQMDTLDSDPGGCISSGYDLVVNGSEIGGGSIRIHQTEIQAKVFGLLGLTDEDAREKFGFLLEALKYGAPPHGGIAFGLDRLVMHLAGTENIREVIAFPKTMTGQDLMTEAPGPVDASQLEECHVRSVVPEVVGVE